MGAEQEFQFSPRDGRFEAMDEMDLAVGEKGNRSPGVVSIVAPAGKEDDSVARSGVLQDGSGEPLTHPSDDLGFADSGGPGGGLPGAHFPDRQDRKRRGRGINGHRVPV